MQTRIDSEDKLPPQPTNLQIISELMLLGRSEFVAKKIVANLQYLRNKNDYFSKSFSKSFTKKLSFFKDCVALLKGNELTLHVGCLRDQCITRLLGQFFHCQRLMRVRKGMKPEKKKRLQMETEPIIEDIFISNGGFSNSKRFRKRSLLFT
jgi:hypothetical protein